MNRTIHSPQPKVVILGLPSLQNSILTGHIKNKIGISCKMETHIRWREEWEHPPHAKTLFLINAELCTKQYQERIDNFLHVTHQQDGDFVLAFFDLQDMHLAEEYIVWPKVNGLFYQDTRQQKFCKGIIGLLNDEYWLPRHLISLYLRQVRKCPKPKPKNTTIEDNLTVRETEVLQLVAAGISNKEISAELKVTQQTIKSHLYNLYKKINARNRVQAVNWALENIDAFNP